MRQCDNCKYWIEYNHDKPLKIGGCNRVIQIEYYDNIDAVNNATTKSKSVLGDNVYVHHNFCCINYAS